MIKYYIPLIFICQCLFVHTLYAQPGTLDLTYGEKGIVITNSESSPLISSGILQADDNMVVFGYNSGFFLSRYLKNGVLDSSFGMNGVSVVSFEGINGVVSGSVIVQSDRKLIAVGWGIPTGSISRFLFLLARYLPDGSLDSSFGLNGKVVTNDVSEGSFIYDYARAAALQPDGKILVAGYRKIFNQGAYDNFFLLKRYLTDGSLDIQFGDSGSVVTQFYYADECYIGYLPADGQIIGRRQNHENLSKPSGELERAVCSYPVSAGWQPGFIIWHQWQSGYRFCQKRGRPQCSCPAGRWKDTGSRYEQYLSYHPLLAYGCSPLQYRWHA